MIDLALCILIASTTPHLSNVIVNPKITIKNRSGAPLLVYRCPAPRIIKK